MKAVPFMEANTIFGGYRYAPLPSYVDGSIAVFCFEVDDWDLDNIMSGIPVKIDRYVKDGTRAATNFGVTTPDFQTLQSTASFYSTTRLETTPEGNVLTFVFPVGIKQRIELIKTRCVWVYALLSGPLQPIAIFV